MIELFDIKEYLNDKGIQYWTGGRNVTEGWINIRCLFCDDNSNHLGISPDLKYHCWKCGAKGILVRLLQEIEGGVSEAEINSYIIPKYQLNIINFPHQVVKEKKPKGAFSLPHESGPLQEIHKNYLLSRNFNSDFLIEKYKLKACWTIGPYKYRIIIPVFLTGELVNFTARDVSGSADTKYKNCPNETAIYPIKNCLYNIDSVQDIMIIVEGPMDVWRLGDGAVCTFGTEWTSSQLSLILSKNPRKIFVMFDGEELAIKKAYQLAACLSGFHKEVQVIELHEGDPGELSEEEVQKLRLSLNI